MPIERKPMERRFVPICTCVGAALTLAMPSSAQQQQGTPPSGLEELEKKIEELKKQHESEISDLREEIDKLAEEAAAARVRSQTPAQQTLSVFNPAITVFGNFLYRSDDRPVYVDDDPLGARVDDQFSLREAEFDFRAPIDPWADGVLISTLEADTPGDYTAGVEEGYVVLKTLPLLDSAPAGLKLKIGRFRPTFGRFNTIHLHDLPQMTYPRALQNFLGPEGFVADGISGEFFLPSPSEKDVLDVTAQVIDGGNIAVAPDRDASDIASVLHLKWFRDLVPGQDLEVGASAWSSNAENQLYGADATYRWKPFVGGEWKSFLFGAEFFQADLADGVHAEHPNGFDLWTQYQLDRNVYVGARYGQDDDLVDSSLVTHTIGAYVTYYTTEFLRFRVGLEHTDSDVAVLDGVDSAFFEMNFIYGSHPAEPYWVNR
ncbi:MAG TPA: hypothetical protein VGR31_06710 [Planctomycetota bacterium]|nr:hypothetical protein [Planctomycetota bacterium]